MAVHVVDVALMSGTSVRWYFSHNLDALYNEEITGLNLAANLAIAFVASGFRWIEVTYQDPITVGVAWSVGTASSAIPFDGGETLDVGQAGVVRRVDVVERICQELIGRIASVILDNSYVFEVAEVVRPTRLRDIAPQDRLVLFLQDDWRDAGSAQFGKVRRILPVTAALFLKVSDLAEYPEPIDMRANLAAAEIEKAVMGDPRLSAQAKHTEFVDPDSAPTKDGAFFYRGINIEVTYGHAYTDPYTPDP